MITVRVMRHSDCPGVGEVHVNSWRRAYSGILPQDYLEKMHPESSAKKCEIGLQVNADVLRLVAVENSIVVGFLMGHENRFTTLVPRARSEIWMLYVDPEKWGHGVGARLLKMFLSRAEGPVAVWVLEENKSARNFYEAMGGELQLACRDFVLNGRMYPEVAYVFSGIPSADSISSVVTK